MVQFHSLLTGFNFRPRLLDLQERATVHTEREAGWGTTAGLYVLERVSCPKRDSNSAPSSSKLNRYKDSATQGPAELQETKTLGSLFMQTRKTSSWSTSTREIRLTRLAFTCPKRVINFRTFTNKRKKETRNWFLTNIVQANSSALNSVATNNVSE
jgi:hypothetical protein